MTIERLHALLDNCPAASDLLSNRPRRVLYIPKKHRDTFLTESLRPTLDEYLLRGDVRLWYLSGSWQKENDRELYALHLVTASDLVFNTVCAEIAVNLRRLGGDWHKDLLYEQEYWLKRSHGEEGFRIAQIYHVIDTSFVIDTIDFVRKKTADASDHYDRNRIALASFIMFTKCFSIQRDSLPSLLRAWMTTRIFRPSPSPLESLASWEREASILCDKKPELIESMTKWLSGNWEELGPLLEPYEKLLSRLGAIYRGLRLHEKYPVDTFRNFSHFHYSRFSLESNLEALHCCLIIRAIEGNRTPAS